MSSEVVGVSTGEFPDRLGETADVGVGQEHCLLQLFDFFAEMLGSGDIEGGKTFVIDGAEIRDLFAVDEDVRAVEPLCVDDDFRWRWDAKDVEGLEGSHFSE